MSADLPGDLDTLVSRLAERLAPLLRPDPERLLDRPALAARLGVGERTIGVLVKRGELPGPLLHTPGTARWSWPQVLKHLQGRQQRKPRHGRGRYRRTSEATTRDREANGLEGREAGQ
jgi:predicted DNA-binding transcriptional regulator AlpA